MRYGNALRRAAGAVAVALALGAGTVASSSAAHADTPTTACPNWYVVTSLTPIEVWIDPEPTGWFEQWNAWPRGRVFCADGTNASGSRYQIRYHCDQEFQSCSPSTHIGWVTTDRFLVTPLNCTMRTLTTSATVWMHPDSTTGTYGRWHANYSFCAQGTNASGTRYKVYHYCRDAQLCPPAARTVVGWVSADSRYYLPPACRPWLPCDQT